MLLIADGPLPVSSSLDLWWVWWRHPSRARLGHLLHVVLIENEVAAIVESRVLFPYETHPLHVGAQLHLRLRANVLFCLEAQVAAYILFLGIWFGASRA